ncbi:hypothetical protein [Planctomyces sp. SH-PL14]|uniref:hypothetical protein n=1 Tax=Planctomyces sp. SH-PL14 TaxID=1632864 RepID=UPI00078D0D1E|nr:hypothetical protein [Planctomyces sp. SH-PL14]AMV20577.1 hypothetical protein VT03_21945 [Planctomyces sp. SH-PL14]
MTLLGVYYPKPDSLDQSLLLIGFAYVVLCGCGARLRLSVPISAALMALCGTAAVAPDLLSMLSDPGIVGTGDLARKMCDCYRSDEFFAMTAYFEVGRGQLMALAGMSAPLLLMAAGRARLDHRRAIDQASR